MIEAVVASTIAASYIEIQRQRWLCIGCNSNEAHDSHVHEYKRILDILMVEKEIARMKLIVKVGLTIGVFIAIYLLFSLDLIGNDVLKDGL